MNARGPGACAGHPAGARFMTASHEIICVDALAIAMRDALAEYMLARSKFPRGFNSAHEGYAVLLEEVDELKAHVWRKQSERDYDAMRKEAIQVAAMAIAFIVEICDTENRT